MNQPLSTAQQPYTVSVPVAPARPPLVRPQQGRLVAGVATGLAAHLGLPVSAVRIALAGATVSGGLGLLLYIWLWALVPTAEQVPQAPQPVDPKPADPKPVDPKPADPAPADTRPADPAPTDRAVPAAGLAPVPAADGTPSPADVAPSAAGPADTAPAPPPRPAPLPPPRDEAVVAAAAATSTRAADLLVGALLLAAGLLVLGNMLGWQISLGLALPLVIVVAGAALVYYQLDEVQGSKWRPGRRRWMATGVRVGLGVALVLGGIMLAVVQSTDVAYAGRVLLAVGVVLGGVLLVLAPWAVRFWRDLDTERAARAREAERADIAAHLHDSVLQTLALIQRNSGDSAQVMRLARAQERDLRGWIYGGGPASHQPARGQRLSGAVQAVVAEVEDRHAVAVDAVVVGDRELDSRGAALVAALREATLNAVRHGRPPVTVYAEATPEGLEASVRDRGDGFDPDAVPGDRYGVRRSILERMSRHGGTAEVRSVAGEGTEIRLKLPDLDADQAVEADDKNERDKNERDTSEREKEEVP